MKNLLFIKLIFSIFILVILTDCKEKTKKINSTLENYDPYLIHNTGFGNISLGDDYQKLIKYCNKNNFTYKHIDNKEVDEYARGFYIYKDSILLLSISNKNWEEPPYKIKFIEFYSNKFRTRDNVRVGSDIKTLKKLFPDMVLQIDNMDDSFVILPKEYQKFDKKGGFNTIFNIYLNIDSAQTNNTSLENLNKNLDGLNAKISHFAVYDWN